MFTILLSVLVAEATVIQCPAPEIRDWTKTQFRYTPDPVEDFYAKGSVVNFQCRHGTIGLNSAEKKYSRKCQQNGTWTAEPLICGLDLTENLRVSTDTGFCNLKKKTCGASMEWNLELNEVAETDGVRITAEEASTIISLEIVDSNGAPTQCSFRKQDSNAYFSYCRVTAAKKVKIISRLPVNIKQINVISSKTGRIGKECPYPGSPSAGKITEYMENSQVTYRCIDGYRLEGQAVRTCNLETGKYDQEMPRCVTELR